VRRNGTVRCAAERDNIAVNGEKKCRALGAQFCNKTKAITKPNILNSFELIILPG